MSTAALFALGGCALVAVARALILRRRIQLLQSHPYDATTPACAAWKGELALPDPLQERLVAATQFRGRGAAAMVEAALSGCFDDMGVDAKDEVGWRGRA